MPAALIAIHSVEFVLCISHYDKKLPSSLVIFKLYRKQLICLVVYAFCPRPDMAKISMRFIVILILLTLFGTSPGRAADPAPAPVAVAKANFSELQPDLTPVRVQKVIDPLTILAENGTLYKLSGIDIPENSTIAVAAQTELITLLKDQDIKLHLTRDEKLGRTTRLGQTLAQIERRKDNLWIEGYLVANGLARVRTTPSNPEMAKQLLILEETAREKKIGLWADPAYAVLTTDQALDKKNSFQIVEGKIFSIAQRNNETFLNFGADWKKDFTIGISPELRRDLSKRNFSFLNLSNKSIRVRGWVEDRNGPFISLDHAQQLELLDKNLPSLQEPISAASRSFKSIGVPEVKTPEVPEVEAPEVKKPYFVPKTKMTINE